VIELAGQYSDGRSAALRAARLRLGEESRVELLCGDEPRIFVLAQLQISERLGNTPRRIRLPGGGQFESADNDALDQWLAAQGRRGGEHWVHRLERRWRWALAALLISVALLGGGIWWGIPAAAERIALSLPAEVNASIGAGTLRLLDEALVGPSELPPARRRALREAFAALAVDHPEEHLRLHFRAGERLGANAFALPDGSIVVTDELVALADRDPAEADAEVLAVLAHEIGHVIRRHGLRGVLQNAGVVTLLAALLGDVGSVTALAATLPTALVHASYSRDFEREADAFALALMDRHGLPRERFASILRKLGEVAGDDHSFLASHPPTTERLQIIGGR